MIFWDGGPDYIDDPVFKTGTDSVLLADFAARNPYRRCMDLGCGGGVLSVLLHFRSPDAVYDSLDIREEAVEICRQNYRTNRIHGGIACLDMREHRSMGSSGQYDMVVCNPPYFYGSKLSPDPARAAARGGSLSPAQFSGAAAYLLKPGGYFCLVHKPEYLTDIFAALRLADLEPKRLRMVCHSAEKAPSLVLIEARRSGRAGLAVEPMLLMHGADGAPTDEIRRIYHR